MIRTPDGKLVKENPVVTQNIENNITTLKLALRRAEILQSLESQPGWEAVQDILREKIKSLSSKRNQFYFLSNKNPQDKSYIDPRQLDLLSQQEADFTFLLNIVDDFVSSVPGLEEKLSQSEKELNERKSAI